MIGRDAVMESISLAHRTGTNERLLVRQTFQSANLYGTFTLFLYFNLLAHL